MHRDHTARLRFALPLSLLPLALAFALAPAGSGCGRRTESPSKRVPVVASIAPIADFVRAVGREHVSVSVLLPQGANPHTFDLRPDHVRMASAARLLVLNGAGLEFWSAKLRDNLTPATRIVETAAGIPLLASDHGHGGNPHVWLDPVLAGRAVVRVRDALCTVDSAHADAYRANAAAYLDSLRALDSDIRARVATWRFRSYVAWHPTLDYFAARYGLEQASTIEKHPGEEISARELLTVVTAIRERRIPAIVGETVSPTKALETIATESGARVVMIDPMGAADATGSYLALMRAIVAALEQALK